MEKQRCKNCKYFLKLYQAPIWSSYYWVGKCEYPIGNIILPEGMRITGYTHNENDGQNCKCFERKE